jgi:hypothetical protein
VDKVILFGSYAYGTPRRESDIDLAVIAPDFNKNPLEELYLLSQSRAAASWDIGRCHTRGSNMSTASRGVSYTKLFV